MTAVTNTRTRGTTAWQAFISLLKGYVGPGCLSLPWAISQLGLVVGTTSVFVVSYWTSLNIWHVVELKRAYQDELLCQEETDGTSTQEDHPETTHAFPQQQQQPQITYPDVGHWLYGKRFAQFLTCMICMQQIAVCTVFLSFIGENLGAALEHLMGEALHHALVITFVLPSALLLTVCMSNLKVLAPIMTVATITLFAGFAVLFVLVFQAWPQRPQPYLVEIQDWANLPLAICAILYSFEGVCLILPIESSMTYGREHFGMVFVSAMVASAVIFAMVAAFCVMAFGRVSSGSITAFLVEQQQQEEGADKEDNLEILNMANLLVSIAVLLTYPLQLFPSYELVGPAVAKYFTTNGGSTIGEEMEENSYVAANSDDEEGGRLHTTTSPERRHNIADDDASTTPVETPFSDEDLNPAAAPTRSSEEVPITDSTADTAGLDTATGLHPETSYWNYYGTSYGDTPTIRVGLVLVTYLFAIVVPNVQLLVSLAGAVSGSATGLLIPPMLQLAHWRRMEQRERQQQQLEEEEEEERLSGQTTNTNSSSQVPVVAYGSWHYQQRRMQCYILFILGCIVLVIGTTSSLWDIIKVYRGVG